MTTLAFYTKPDCSLCDDALEKIERVRSDVPFDLREIDISSDQTLIARYGERIPVVEIDGVEAFELQIDESELKARLEGAQMTAGRDETMNANDMGTNR